MNKALILPLLLGLGVPVSAQDDVIHWTDGTSTEKARVTGYSLVEVNYQSGGRSETKPAGMVDSMELAEMQETYRRGYSGRDPGQFLNEARRLAGSDRSIDQLLAAKGFVEAARLFYEYGEDANAVRTVEELAEKLPESGLLPELYRLKMTVYLSMGTPRGLQNADTVANEYHEQAVSNGWPSGFTHEARYYQLLVSRLKGETPPEQLADEYRSLLSQTRGTYQTIANRVNVQLADVLRKSGDAEGARRIYESVVDREDVDDPTRAGAYLGLGHIAYESAGPGDTQTYYDAMMSFLRVYLETKDAWGSQVAEALYYGSQAAREWGGENSRRIAGRLRGRLEREYPGSEWANK